MSLLLKNANCVDATAGFTTPTLRDVLIIGEKIESLGEPGCFDSLAQAQPADPTGPLEICDLAGKLLFPGLMDMHVHLRDPGFEYKEDIETGTRAAAHGGFSAVLAMANTNPVIDTGSLVNHVHEKARQKAVVRVYTTGALTANQAGQALAEMADMAEAGAVAFSDDGHGVQDAGLMRLALEYAATIKRPVLVHCQDDALVGSGQVNEGAVSTRLGLAGWPAAGEEVQIARDIALAEITGAALHIQHVSTARGLQLITAAKAKGMPVTCEVTPHHLFLDENELNERYDTNLKMNPPLRTAEDAQALCEALIEGGIDCVATDHAPHAAHEKSLEFELAPFGVTGLETALSLVYTRLVATDRMTLAQLVERMAHAPRRILNIEPVSLQAGSTADLTVFDPQADWQVDRDSFLSKSANSAFLGVSLKGCTDAVYINGKVVFTNGGCQ